MVSSATGSPDIGWPLGCEALSRQKALVSISWLFLLPATYDMCVEHWLGHVLLPELFVSITNLAAPTAHLLSICGKLGKKSNERNLCNNITTI